MRRRKPGERRQAAGITRCETPCHETAPVVPDKVDPLGAAHVDEGRLRHPPVRTFDSLADGRAGRRESSRAGWEPSSGSPVR